jgi:hypothetical protein
MNLAEKEIECNNLCIRVAMWLKKVAEDVEQMERNRSCRQSIT